MFHRRDLTACMEISARRCSNCWSATRWRNSTAAPCRLSMLGSHASVGAAHLCRKAAEGLAVSTTPSSTTRPGGGVDCNRSAMTGFAQRMVEPQVSYARSCQCLRAAIPSGCWQLGRLASRYGAPTAEQRTLCSRKTCARYGAARPLMSRRVTPKRHPSDSRSYLLPSTSFPHAPASKLLADGQRRRTEPPEPRMRRRFFGGVSCGQHLVQLL